MAKDIGAYIAVGVTGKFNISPSMAATFMDNSRKWYESQILKTDSFNGNTNTVLGTIVHAGIEAYFDSEQLTSEDVSDYLIKYYANRDDIDDSEVLAKWSSMVLATVSSIVSVSNNPDMQEYQTIYEIDDEVTVGGTVDYRRGEVLGDYKTCKTLKKTIDNDYKWQLMIYAYCDKMAGRQTDTLEITFIQRPDEGYPSPKTGKTIGVKKVDVLTVQYAITTEDWIEVEELIKTIADTYKLGRANQTIEHLLYRENKLSFRQ